MDLQLLIDKLQHQTRKTREITRYVNCLEKNSEHPFFKTNTFLQLKNRKKPYVNYLLINTYDSVEQLAKNSELDGKLYKQLRDKGFGVALCRGIFCYDHEDNREKLYPHWTFEKMMAMDYRTKKLNPVELEFENTCLFLKGDIIKCNQSCLTLRNCNFLRITAHA